MTIDELQKKYNVPVWLQESVPRSDVLDIVEDLRFCLRNVERLTKAIDSIRHSVWDRSTGRPRARRCQYDSYAEGQEDLANTLLSEIDDILAAAKAVEGGEDE